MKHFIQLSALLGVLFILIGCPSTDSVDDDATGDDDASGDDDVADDDAGDDDAADDDAADDDAADDDTADDDDDTTPCADGDVTKGTADTMWVTICGGTFQMGSNEHSTEEPIHSVSIPTFEMLATEVTVAQYAQCPSPGDCSAPAIGDTCNWNDTGYEDHPVNCVVWQQAVDFCAWVGGRLASESEWEYAARSGGLDIRYPWGGSYSNCDYAVSDTTGFDDGCSTGRTWPVCSKSPNGDSDQGLCDLAGNVDEWVQDYFHACYDCSACPGQDCDNSSVAPSDGSAWEFPASAARVARGGSFYEYQTDLTTTRRVGWVPDHDVFDRHGIRCVR